MSKIAEYGYIRPYVSDKEVDAELIRHTTSVKLYSSRGMFNAHAPCGFYNIRPGSPIIYRYCDLADLHRGDADFSFRAGFESSKALFVALQQLINHTALDLNISAIHSVFHRRQYGPRWANPIVLYAILKQQFEITPDTVLVDPVPNVWEKYITARYLGCRYSSPIQPPSAMMDRLGVPFVGKSNDLVVLDGCFKLFDHDLFKSLRVTSQRMLVFVPSDMAKLASEDRPDRAIKVRVSPLGQPAYLFLYRKPLQKYP